MSSFVHPSTFGLARLRFFISDHIIVFVWCFIHVRNSQHPVYYYHFSQKKDGISYFQFVLREIFMGTNLSCFLCSTWKNRPLPISICDPEFRYFSIICESALLPINRHQCFNYTTYHRYVLSNWLMCWWCELQLKSWAHGSHCTFQLIYSHIMRWFKNNSTRVVPRSIRLKSHW